jgi:hypothetical protein
MGNYFQINLYTIEELKENIQRAVFSVSQDEL